METIIPPDPEAEKSIDAFLAETGTNEELRNANMATTNVEELAAVANDHGFAFSAADMIRHQAQTVLTFTDEELELYTRSGPWWQLCLEAYARYGR